MKLVLANNQSKKFTSFYEQLSSQSAVPLDYSGYESMLFLMDTDSQKPLRAVNLATGKSLDEYDGVYINGYLNTYELAAATAIVCDALGVPFVDRELHNPPSLSKLSSYAKLAAAGVRLPKTAAGTKNALLQSQNHFEPKFPAVLKRADADRGIDNFKIMDVSEMQELLELHDSRSIWILQEYIENDGFYRVSCFNGIPEFAIFRSLENRPDGNLRKSHMYKPKGGSNASLIDVNELPESIISEATNAIRVMNRQIGSVDCLYDKKSLRTHVLEVNYNPQLVTIETYKEVRAKAFLEFMSQDWDR